MVTLPAYRSTHTRWQRLKDAFFTAYVNLHIRRAERPEPFVTVKDLDERVDAWRRA